MYRFLLSLLLLAPFLFVACDDEAPTPPNEEEVITTLRYTLSPADGGDPIVFEFRDLDGDGGSAPSISAPPLAANAVYGAQITLLNEQVTPSEEINPEIISEALDHQLFYQTDVPGLTVTYLDADVNGFPLGLTTQLRTGAPATGELTVALIHEPTKNMEGDPDGVGGETDIEVTFPVTVQ